MRPVFCKVKNQIKDAHHKISKFLCENYYAILLPDFKSSEMVQTGKRNIQNETVRKMLTWSHYKFKHIILAKAKRYGLIVPCSEHYTSKTCSECGNIDHKLRASNIYHCKCCASIMDRDLNNAAKNILLKFVIEQTTERA
jgi:putative transposase